MAAPTGLFGKYQVRRELGRGAMGIVYEASDPVNNELVALKIISLPTNATPESFRRQQERFDREAQAMALLGHPRVVRLLDQGQIQGRHYFAMELLRGTTLRDRLQFQGPLSVSELTRLAIEMCHALDHVHLRGVVHRDVKPENLMLMPDGSSKLMDFGVARLVLEKDTPVSAGFQGSPAYMSPEQVSGGRVDGRSDLYSLAVTLYEAATGRRAVPGDSIAEIVHRVVSEYPAPPVGLPPSLQGVLMRAMAKDPLQRYARGWDMAEDIRLQRVPALNFSPIPAAVAPAPPRPERAYLGSEPGREEGGISPAALAQFLLPDGPPAVPPAAPASLPTCRLHPATVAVESCSRCGQPMCHTCRLEVPGRGVICRTCAFASP